MRGFSCLPLRAFLVLGIICSTSGAPYSKYGRTCKDIGCLPREVCVMAYESCSFSQQENVSCGRYPTCKKNTDQAVQPNSGSSSPGGFPPSNSGTSIWNTPATVKYTTERTTTTTRRPWATQPSYFAPTTTRRAWTTPPPFYNPANPSYNGGGGYFGNRYGDDTTFGSFTRPPTRYTTKRPSSSSSGSGFDGFLSGLSNVLSGEVGKFFSSAISNRGGSGSGGFGSLFGGDTRPLNENKNYRGGLFSENTGSTSGGSSKAPTETVGGYPVTRFGEASAPQSNPTNSQASHGNIGWKLS